VVMWRRLRLLSLPPLPPSSARPRRRERRPPRRFADPRTLSSSFVVFLVTSLEVFSLSVYTLIVCTS
jgi:hypothetical protein